MANSNIVAANVFGDIDGESMAVSKVQEMQKFVEPLRTQVSKYIQPKPWVEFLKIELAVPKKENVMTHLDQNIKEYKGNYACVLAILLVCMIITSPWCLFVVGCLLAGWVAFLRKNEDETWQVSIGGIAVGKMQRLYTMATLSALIVILFLGNAIGSVVFCGAIFVLGHGVMHKPVMVDAYEEENII